MSFIDSYITYHQSSIWSDIVLRIIQRMDYGGLQMSFSRKWSFAPPCFRSINPAGRMALNFEIVFNRILLEASKERSPMMGLGYSLSFGKGHGENISRLGGTRKHEIQQQKTTELQLPSIYSNAEVSNIICSKYINA